MNSFPSRATAAAVAVLLAAGCSSTGDSDSPTDGRQSAKTPVADARFEIRPGKDLVAHQGVAVAAIDRETLRVRAQTTVPEPITTGLLAGTGSVSRSFDRSFRYALLGAGGVSAEGAGGALKVADLTAAGSDGAVLTLTREQLTAAGVTGTVSGAQFSASAGRPHLWFQTTASDSPSGETWSGATSGQYKITMLWSVDVKAWQAGDRNAARHKVPPAVQEYWQSQECQTAFSRSAGQEGFTPWSCWLVDAAGVPVPSGPADARTVTGTADTGWTNPAAGAGAGSEKATFSYVKGSDGKPATPVSVSGAGGNGASTLDGTSGLIDSGPAASGERKMWRFTTVGAQLKLQELSTALPPSSNSDDDTQLWAFPDGRAVARVEEGDSSTGWILTAAGKWKKTGPWAADLQDAEVGPTA
ncbi:hypothetical protein [Streptomyces niveus]|uniref:hypothetical protein n=1 Tax=Streptomyces niveus TaxID=193462 RepID=UPI0034162068